MIVELRGLPPYVGIPPFSRCVGLSGTNLGTLRGFSLASVQATATALAVRFPRFTSILVALFYAGGGGTPALGRAFLRAKHGRRPPSEAVACRLPSFFTSFLQFFFLFLDFLHFRHIRGFVCDTPVF